MTCPRCGSIIARAEAERLTALYAAHVAAGGVLATGVLTLAHGPLDSLADLLTAQDAARRYATNGRAWLKARKALSLTGYTAHRETTYGRNGWHPHVHMVLLLEREVTDEELNALWQTIATPYRARLAREGIATSGVCNEIQRVRSHEHMARYLAGEQALGQSKTSKGRTPFALLSDFETTGDMAAAAVFNEWENAMTGRRWRQYSSGLAGEYDITAGTEAADIAVAAAEDAGDVVGTSAAETVLRVDVRTWRALARRRGVVVSLLVLVEDGQDEQARALVESVRRASALPG